MRRLPHPRTLSPSFMAAPVTIAVVFLVCALSLGQPSDVVAGANPDFRIMLHAKMSGFEPCNGFLPLDCFMNPPTVNLPSVGPVAVFVMVHVFNELSGIQTGLQFPGWQVTYALLDCQLTICDPNPCQPIPDPNGIIIDVDFNCDTLPGLAVIGRVFLVPAGNPGCISQWTPDLPNGIHVRDCSGGVDTIENANSLRLGKICVGSGGVTSCDDDVPVEPTTWGKIKATY
jgi:hypothetical protein